MVRKTGPDIECKQCGKAFHCPPSAIKKGKRFCSLECRDFFRKLANHDFEKRIKKCACCETWKSFDDFQKVKSSDPDDRVFQAYCKECHSKKTKGWAEQNKDRRAEINRQYAERVKADPNKKPRTLTEEQKAKKNKLRNEWGRRNLDKVLMWNKIRAHRNRGAGPMPKADQLRSLMCFQDYKCVYCGSSLGKGMHLDHKVPLVKGGSNDLSNLQWLCKPCNLKKATTPHDEYSEIVGTHPIPETALPSNFDCVAFVEAMERGDYAAAMEAFP